MAVMDYRTRDGLADYGFSIEFESGVGWRVYIVFQPFREGHDENVQVRMQLPYQASDRQGRCYVNWSSRIDSLGDAKAVAALWAELIQRYLHTSAHNRGAPKGKDRPGDGPRSGYPTRRLARTAGRAQRWQVDDPVAPVLGE